MGCCLWLQEWGLVLFALLRTAAVLRGHIIIILSIGDSITVIIITLGDRDTAIAQIANSIAIRIDILAAYTAILATQGRCLPNRNPCQ